MALKECGIDINHTAREDKMTALHFAVNSKQYEFIELLVQNGADVTCKNKFGYTACDLQQCLYKSDLELANKLKAKPAANTEIAVQDMPLYNFENNNGNELLGDNLEYHE